MSRPLWFVTLVKKAFPTRYFLALLARKVPPVRKLIDHFLFEGDAIIYLPKDNVIQVNQPIAHAEETVLPSQIVERFIEQANYRWIMNKCICRDSEQCKDYPIDLGCLFLGEAVLQINPKLGHLATKEEALAHLKRAREAGLVHLIGRNRIDSVWLGATPLDKLLTICNCCPCCCLWRVLPHLPPEISGNVTRMPGVTVTVTDRCVGCGTCTRGVCFVDAIRLVDGRAVIDEICRGCGRCVEICPQHAIELRVEDSTFVEQAIARLTSLVDIS
jgi:ferredoxin